MSFRLAVYAIAILAFVTRPAAAQDGTWSQATTGTYDWGTAANWTGGVVANGANSTANFTTPSLTGPITVNLEAPRTIGNLVFDNPTNTFGWTITGTGANILTLNAATPTVTVNNANLVATISAQVAGNQGLTKAGPGTLFLTGNNTVTGGMTVAAGVLSATRSAANNPLGANAVTLSGGTLRIGAPIGGINPVSLTTGTFTHDMVVETGAVFAGSITATMDGGAALTGATWYERGQNATAPLTGLPMNQTVTSQSNPNARYALLSGTVNNAVLLDAAGNARTLTFANPTALASLSFLTSSGNGSGTLTATLHFSDGPPDVTGLVLTSGDWFNGNPIVINANGRISAGGYDNVNNNNPRLYDATINIPAAAVSRLITSIDLAWTGSGADTHSAIFGLSGAAGTIAQTFTNTIAVTANSTIDIQTIQSATLGNLTIGTNTLSVTGVNTAALTLGTGTLGGDATFDVATGVTATLAGLADAGTARIITKTGVGTLAVGTVGAGTSAGTQVAVNGGTLLANGASPFGPSPAVTTGGGTFSLGANQTVASLAGTSGGVALNGNTLTINSAASTTFNGRIANGSATGGGLVKAGAGQLTLAGASSYTGGTTVNAGTLSAAQPGALGTGPVNLTGASTLVVAGVPAASVTGFGGTGTGWTLNGTPTIAADDLTITAAVNGQVNSAWSNTQVPVRSFTANFTYQVTAGSASPADGATFTLQNQGLTALGGGGGELGYSNIAPSAALGINLFTGAAGGLRGVRFFTNGQNVGGPYQPVTPVNLVDPANAMSGNPIDFTITYNAPAGTLTLNLVEQNTTNTFNITLPNIDLQSTLNGNTAFVGFTGATGGLNAEQHIRNFSLNVPAQSVYANAVSVPAGATPTIAVAATAAVPNVTLGPLSANGNSTLSVRAATGGPANLAYGLTFGPTLLSGTVTIDVANNGTGAGTVTLGAISDGLTPGALVKMGGGTLVLPAAGTYTGGTTVQAFGTLLVTNTTGSATGTGPVTVPGAGGPALGGTLGGTGTIAGPVTVNTAQGPGIIAPGIAGVGTLTLGNGLTLAGQYTADVTTTPTNVSDLLAITGNLNLSGILNLPGSNSYAPLSAGVTYTLITFSGTRTGVFGTVNGLPADYQLVYAGNAVQLVPVPEPAHLLLLCAAAAGVARWWQRSRQPLRTV